MQRCTLSAKVVVPSTKSSRTTSFFTLFSLFFVILFFVKVVVPSTKSSRTASFVLLYFLLFYYRESGRALNQVKPNHFFCFALFFSLFAFRGSGRALNQVKPNHFHLFVTIFFVVSLRLTIFLTVRSCYFIYNNR